LLKPLWANAVIQVPVTATEPTGRRHRRHGSLSGLSR
jgi:hypothetical protein